MSSHTGRIGIGTPTNRVYPIDIESPDSWAAFGPSEKGKLPGRSAKKKKRIDQNGDKQHLIDGEKETKKPVHRVGCGKLVCGNPENVIEPGMRYETEEQSVETKVPKISSERRTSKLGHMHHDDSEIEEEIVKGEPYQTKSMSSSLASETIVFKSQSKVSEISLERRPSTLAHMHHYDSEIERPEDEIVKGEPYQTKRRSSSLVSDTVVCEFGASELNLERRPSTLAHMIHDDSESEGPEKECVEGESFQTDSTSISFVSDTKVFKSGVSEINLELRPSTPAPMHHDDSGNENQLKEIDSIKETATPVFDDTATKQESKDEASSKTRVSETTVSKISLERRPSTPSNIHRDGGDKEDQQKEIGSMKETANPLLNDTATKQATSGKENQQKETDSIKKTAVIFFDETARKQANKIGASSTATPLIDDTVTKQASKVKASSKARVSKTPVSNMSLERLPSPSSYMHRDGSEKEKGSTNDTATKQACKVEATSNTRISKIPVSKITLEGRPRTPSNMRHNDTGTKRASKVEASSTATLLFDDTRAKQASKVEASSAATLFFDNTATTQTSKVKASTNATLMFDDTGTNQARKVEASSTASLLFDDTATKQASKVKASSNATLLFQDTATKQASKTGAPSKKRVSETTVAKKSLDRPSTPSDMHRDGYNKQHQQKELDSIQEPATSLLNVTERKQGSKDDDTATKIASKANASPKTRVSETTGTKIGVERRLSKPMHRDGSDGEKQKEIGSIKETTTPLFDDTATKQASKVKESSKARVSETPVTSISLERRPSTSNFMHCDVSGKEDQQKEIDSIKESPTPLCDDTATKQASKANVSPKTTVSETPVSKINFERRPPTPSYMHRDGSDKEDKQKQIDSIKKTLTPIFDDTATKQAREAKVSSQTRVSDTTVSKKGLEGRPSSAGYMFQDGTDEEDQQKEIESNKETATPLFGDTTTKQESKDKASSDTRVSKTTVSNISLERRPPTPSNVFHDGSDEEDQQKENDSNKETATALFDDTTTKQAGKDETSSKTRVSETTVSKISLERRPSTPSFMHREESGKEEQQKQIDGIKEIATPLFDDTATKQARSDKEEQQKQIETVKETATTLIDDTATKQACKAEKSPKTSVSENPVSKIKLERPPLTPSYMQQNESGKEEQQKQIDGIKDIATPLFDDTATKQASKVEASSKTRVPETTVSMISLERRPSTPSYMDRDGSDKGQQKEIVSIKETATPLFYDNATKQASEASSKTRFSETTVSTKGLERHPLKQAREALSKTRVSETPVSKIRLEGRPSTPSYMRDGSDKDKQKQRDSIKEFGTPIFDDIATKQASKVKPSSKTKVLETTTPKISLERRPLTPRFIHRDGRDKEDQLKQIDRIKETATPLFEDTTTKQIDSIKEFGTPFFDDIATKQASKAKTSSQTRVLETPVSKIRLERRPPTPSYIHRDGSDKEDKQKESIKGTATPLFDSTRKQAKAEGSSKTRVSEIQGSKLSLKRRIDKSDTVTKTVVGTKPMQSALDSSMAKTDKHSSVIEERIIKKDFFTKSIKGAETKKTGMDFSQAKSDKRAVVIERRTGIKTVCTKTNVGTMTTASLMDSSLAKADKHDKAKEMPRNQQTYRLTSRRTMQFKINHVFLEYTEFN